MNIACMTNRTLPHSQLLISTNIKWTEFEVLYRQWLKKNHSTYNCRISPALKRSEFNQNEKRIYRSSQPKFVYDGTANNWISSEDCACAQGTYRHTMLHWCKYTQNWVTTNAVKIPQHYDLNHACMDKASIKSRGSNSKAWQVLMSSRHARWFVGCTWSFFTVKYIWLKWARAIGFIAGTLWWLCHNVIL